MLKWIQMKSAKLVFPLVLSLFFCFITFLNINDYGITWDETAYFLAGDSYAAWLARPSPNSINQYWSANCEHPPLAKIFPGIAKQILSNRLKLLHPITAFRSGNLVFVFLLIFFLFRFAEELYGKKIAAFAACSFFFLPRIFFHAHLCALDYPITAMWFLFVYSFYKFLNNQKWGYLSAAALGLALLTKINAFYLYLPVVFFWFYAKLPPKKIFPFLYVPAAMFFILWPWLWQNPIGKAAGYIGFHFFHVKLPVYYFGIQYLTAPWHYPFVLTLLTVPFYLLILFFTGLVKLNSGPDRKTALLILLNILLPILIIASPRIPKYDGIRLFMPAFPFICLLAGGGLDYILKYFSRFKAERAVYILFCCLMLIAVYFSIIKIHPFQDSYFNGIIGGIQGAFTAGFESEYWGSPYKETVPFMNRYPGKTFFIPIAGNIFDYYHAIGYLDRKVKTTGEINNVDYAVVLMRQGTFSKAVWFLCLYKKPVYSVKVDGVSLVNVYQLR